jgi:hypothetical protein
MAMLLVVSEEASSISLGHSQDGHEGGEPQLLATDECIGIGPPLSRLDVESVSQDDECPRSTETQPSNEAVVSLEGIVVVAADCQLTVLLTCAKNQLTF